MLNVGNLNGHILVNYGLFGGITHWQPYWRYFLLSGSLRTWQQI